MNEATTSPLLSQLATASEVILANGWCDRERLDRARAIIGTIPDPIPTAGRSRIAQYLVDQRLLTREQAQDLDAIMRNQANLPGFKLLRKIGSGGMGIVFLATHLSSGRRCALKTLNTRLATEADFINRFHREAQALVGIQHPSIADVIESGECDGHCYLAMEYIEGPSAMTLLRDYKALPEIYAVRIIKQVAEGLSHVYAKAKLVHRDVKPENILIVRNATKNGELFGDGDQAKLIDFGLVKSMSDDDQRLTQTGMTIGTPLYMSPEQVRGEDLDCRSDIYGLGATLYHLLTGTTPFGGGSPGAIMSAHLTEAVPDPGIRVPSLSAETKQLITISMAKDPQSRYLTHDALIAACSKVIEVITGKGEGAPKLLLKPMVLKSIRKPDTGRHTASPRNGTVASSSNSHELSSRIIAKHRQLQAGGEIKHETSITHRVRRSPQTEADPGFEAASSDAPATQSALSRLTMPRPATPTPPIHSELLAEAKAAAGQSAGIGWLPITVLTLAVIALLIYRGFFWH